MNDNVTYQVSFEIAKLKKDLATKLKGQFPVLANRGEEDRLSRLVDYGISQIQNEGDRAVYKGLLEIARNNATRLYSQEGEDRIESTLG